MWWTFDVPFEFPLHFVDMFHHSIGQVSQAGMPEMNGCLVKMFESFHHRTFMLRTFTVNLFTFVRLTIEVMFGAGSVMRCQASHHFFQLALVPHDRSLDFLELLRVNAIVLALAKSHPQLFQALTLSVDRFGVLVGMPRFNAWLRLVSFGLFLSDGKAGCRNDQHRNHERKKGANHSKLLDTRKGRKRDDVSSRRLWIK